MRFLPALVLLALLPAPARAAVLHVAPGAGAAACSVAQPCDLPTAFAAAGTGDEIVLAAGVYAQDGSLPSPVPGLEVRGPQSGEPPLIAFTGTARLSLFGDGARLARVRVTGAPTAGLPVAQAPSLDHVVARSTGAGDGCSASVAVHDSACSSTGGAGLALRSLNGSGLNLDLRSATLVGGTYGLEVRTFAVEATSAAITARNVIFRGLSGDVRLDPFRTAPGTTVDLALTAAHSRYAITNTATDGSAGGDPAQIVDAGGNVALDPGFRDLEGGDLRLTDGAITVDAGSATAPLAATDARGYPRTIGSAPDIGAYEHVSVPPAAVLGAPAPGATLAGEPLTVRWTMPRDAQPGSVRLRLVPRDGLPATTVDLAGETAGTHEVTLERALIPDGLYDLALGYREPIEGREAPEATAAGVRLAPPPPGTPLPPAAETPAPAPAGAAGPAIVGLRVAPRAFRAARPGTARFTLTAPARVTVITERRAGRRWVRVGFATRSLRAGRTTLRVRRGLRRAPHRVRITARDAAGRRSAPATAAFRVS
ncbi:MAG: hypothetical protein MUC84_03560 [Solirubrobacteraceae bacterium]|jgi:hypothetical protein|nr:hypothetical protein [Solirubrobacteraceae bacterium]